MSQFDVAAAIIDPSCRAAPSSNLCNSEQDLNVALTKTGNLASGDGYGGYHMGPGPCAPSDIGSEILTLQRPICCHIKWSGVVGNGEAGHFVTLTGYDDSTQEVCVEDSRDGSSTWMAYGDFVNSFDGQGQWDYTYWTSP
jgi:Papain-like cysteine protease AvrRpt2